jgi:hypothetical protein
MDVILEFLVHAWQHLGLPAKVQFDNSREFCGFGYAACYLSPEAYEQLFCQQEVPLA